MSTKQTIIFTFMLIFLTTTVIAIGAWLSYSAELRQKEVQIAMLTIKRSELRQQIEGTTTVKGLRDLVKDPQEGLEKKLREAVAAATAEVGDANSGMIQRQNYYDEKAAALPPKWNDAQGKWKTVYEDWTRLNNEIDQSYKRLIQQQREGEAKVGESQADLDRELATESAERKKLSEGRKGMKLEMAKVGKDIEEVQERLAEVSRQARKAVTVEPQGRVVFADEKLKLVSIDIGAQNGVKQGLIFEVYSGAHTTLVNKARAEVYEVHPSYSLCRVLGPKKVLLEDPLTGFVQRSNKDRFSPYAAGGLEGLSAQELEKPKTRKDRQEAFEEQRLKEQMGTVEYDEMRRRESEPGAPPIEIGTGFVLLSAGDWVHSAEFIPVMTEREFEKRAVAELESMRDINIAPLTFYLTDSVPVYRREYLQRLMTRNRCTVAAVMTSDVTIVITSSGNTRADLLEQQLSSTKGKEEVSGEIKNLRKTLEALQAGQKIGASVMAEDQVEGFFVKRARKLELIGGRSLQPGRNTFYVAGETRKRSVEQTRRYIADHGGVVRDSMTDNVDYIVVGAGLDQAFYNKVKAIGLKILREDELDWFFGKASK